ncbi:MAG: hypothetical protein H6730_34770 [Deltaproteobacteria bacterium]|nr:hypothetical protein [Deltaproteobacteria bacterium]
MSPLRPENSNLLQGLLPYVVVTPENRPHFDLAPFGLAIAEAHVIDPLHTGSAPFLERLETLDGATFGPEGMPMPRWVFFDGAELPGGIVGLARPAENLSARARTLFKLPTDAAGLVPLSMFIAIPTFEPGEWMGHNLASLGPMLPDAGLKGLASYTKALGLAVFRARKQIGVTQWNSTALAVHTRLGPLELLSAWTPAHSEPWSLTYRVTITEAALRSLAREPEAELPRPEPERWVHSDDHATMKALQVEIEAGARYVITGRPRILDHEHLEVPVARV